MAGPQDLNFSLRVKPAISSRQRVQIVTARWVEGYEIQHRIGRGGMGDVFLGERPDGVAAIKLLPRLATDNEYLNRFTREAAAPSASATRISPALWHWDGRRTGRKDGAD